MCDTVSFFSLSPSQHIVLVTCTFVMLQQCIRTEFP